MAIKVYGTAVTQYENHIVENDRVVTLEDFTNSTDNENLQAAFDEIEANGGILRIMEGPYSFSGEFEIPSGAVVKFINSVIEFDLSGENGRGFMIRPGSKNTRIEGSAAITTTCSSAGSDGSRNTLFNLGSDFYYTTSPDATENSVIDVCMTVDMQGPSNAKVVACLGNVEGAHIKGIQAKGMSNYFFYAHWSGDGSSGVLPSETMHGKNIIFENCKVNANSVPGGPGTPTIRSFTLTSTVNSGVINCETINTNTLGFNIFVGDYGAQYAANITKTEHMTNFIRDCYFEGAGNVISCDAISSRLNGSAQWSGNENNASLVVDNLRAIMDANTNNIGFAITGLYSLKMSNCSYQEVDSNNTKNCFQTYGCRYVDVTNCFFKAQKRALIRAAKRVNFQGNIERYTNDPTTAASVLEFAAGSTTTTTSAAVSLGATSIPLNTFTGVYTPGCYLKYTDGSSVDHYMEILSTTYSGYAQTITTRPTTSAISSGDTVTLIHRVDSVNVRDTLLIGGGYGLRFTGTATARCRNINISGLRTEYIGYYDLYFDAAEFFNVNGMTVSNNGQVTGGSSPVGVKILGDARVGSIRGVFFDETCTGMRYGIEVNNSADYINIHNCHTDAIDTGATSPALIFLNSATDSTQTDNTTLGAITVSYP